MYLYEIPKIADRITATAEKACINEDPRLNRKSGGGRRMLFEGVPEDRLERMELGGLVFSCMLISVFRL